MIDFSATEMESIALHKVGNKLRDEGIVYSASLLKPDEAVNASLMKYFLSPFKGGEFYQLQHDSNLEMNEVYNYISDIFDDPSVLYDQSRNLAMHLYAQSEHPMVKEGEFYVAFLKDCEVEGETMDAVGLFKSESKETFLKICQESKGYFLEAESGINLNKLDKGCLIFNVEKEKGYLVAVIDNTNKGNDARYWKDGFLQVKAREDNYFHTQNALRLCKNFITEKLPEGFDVTKDTQVDLMNKSIKYFKEHEDFSVRDFEKEVISQPQVIESFKEYRKEYEEQNDISISDRFNISGQAVKKQSRVMKSVIKLDKNFHIYVHGNKENIVRGYDEESGRYFYQLFFREES
jgi:hypothetical protein